MYNLLMVYREGTWDEPEFLLETNRFLEYTADAIKSRFSSLDATSIAALKDMPALFAYEDRGGFNEGHDLSARVGRIMELQVRNGGVRITWKFDLGIPPISPERFRELFPDLDVDERNWERTRTHWAVKDVDLYSVLRSRGLSNSSTERAPPTVFISYSWDSNEHKQWVRTLATQLRSNGIDAMADFSHVRPGEDITAFMELADRADRVIAVCTENYMRRAAERIGGVGYEHLITASALMQDLTTAKYIPVIRNAADAAHMPPVLRGRAYVDLSEGPDLNQNFQSLIRDLHGESFALQPLGPRPIF